MPSLSRREFVKLSGLASLAASLPVSAVRAQAAAARPNPICLFTKHVHWLEPDEFGPYLKDLGFDGVDLTVRPGGHVLPEQAAQRLPQAVRSLTRSGLSVPMMVTSINDAGHPLTESILGAAADAGIKYYRLGYFRYDPALGVQASLEKLRPTLEKLAALNEKLGIHGGWQNHDGIWPGASIWDLWYVIKDLDPRWLGVQFDLRHAVAEGGRSWINDFDLVKGWVRTTVAKDFHWAKNDSGAWFTKHVPMGEGMVDFERFYTLYRQYNLSGPISLHVEFPLFDRDEKTMSKAEKTAAAKVVFTRELATLRKRMVAAGLQA